MSLYYVIEYKLQSSDHDGYCSDNECHYNEEIKIFESNKILEEHKYLYDCELNEYDDKYFISLLPKLCLWENSNKFDHTFKSGYCTIDFKSKHERLSQHDYKYEILRVSMKIK
jgi:hypothetical protein